MIFEIPDDFWKIVDNYSKQVIYKLKHTTMTIKNFFSKSKTRRIMTARRTELLQAAITKVYPNCTLHSRPLFYITHPDDEVLTLDIHIMNRIPNGKSFKSKARFEIDFDAEYNKAMKDLEAAVIEFIEYNSTYNAYMDNHYGID